MSTDGQIRATERVLAEAATWRACRDLDSAVTRLERLADRAAHLTAGEGQALQRLRGDVTAAAARAEVLRAALDGKDPL